MPKDHTSQEKPMRSLSPPRGRSFSGGLHSAAMWCPLTHPSLASQAEAGCTAEMHPARVIGGHVRRTSGRARESIPAFASAEQEQPAHLHARSSALHSDRKTQVPIMPSEPRHMRYCSFSRSNKKKMERCMGDALNQSTCLRKQVVLQRDHCRFGFQRACVHRR